MKKKIVTIGGGTGQYTLLRGLKNYDIELTALVSMVDDGGSAGQLRDEYGILPSGDIRRCLIALANDEKAKTLRDLFEIRFDDKLKSHNFGNLFLFALEKLTGSNTLAIKEAEKLLGVKGNVLPITIYNSILNATTSLSRQLKGQINISYNLEKQEKVKNIWLEPNSFILGEAAEAIRQADLIIICPGDLYGSIIPSFLVQGVKEALQESKAKKVYVCNLVTKQGSADFTAQDFIKEIEKYSGIELDYVILNTKKPTQQICDKYKGENSDFVEPNPALTRKLIKEELLLEQKSDGKILARHDANKTAKIIISLL